MKRSESPQPLLEETALAAVRQWKYEPCMVKGKAVAVTFTGTMTFALDKEKKQDKVRSPRRPFPGHVVPARGPVFRRSSRP